MGHGEARTAAGSIGTHLVRIGSGEANRRRRWWYDFVRALPGVRLVAHPHGGASVVPPPIPPDSSLADSPIGSPVDSSADSSAEWKETEGMSQEYPFQQPTPPPGPGTSSQWKEQINRLSRDVEVRSREIIDEGNARRLVVRHQGRDLVNLPLTVAAIGGGILVIASPPIAILAVLGALFARVDVRIER
jgi:hypothetical protein